MTVVCMVVLWIIAGIAAAILVWGVILQLPKTRGNNKDILHERGS